jgi:hypothetical protein
MAWWNKGKSSDSSDDGVQVTPLPGGRRQETGFAEDGVTPVYREIVDEHGKSVGTVHYNEAGDVIATEGDVTEID